MSDTKKPEELRLVKVHAVPEPFGTRYHVSFIRDGQTIAEALEAFRFPNYARICAIVNGIPVPPEKWYVYRLLHGDNVVVRASVFGGGGDGKKNPLQIVLGIALIAASAGFSAHIAKGGQFLGLTGSKALIAGSLGIGFVGALAQRALIKPPTVDMPQNVGYSQDAPLQNITGIRNQANLYGVVPRVYGQIRMFPPLAAKPYTSLQGNEQYLHMVFAVSKEDEAGDIIISDIKIGDTTLDNFSGVEIEKERSVYQMSANEKAFWAPNVTETQLDLQVKKTDSWVTRTTAEGTNEIIVDISCPQLVAFNTSTGAKVVQSVQMQIEYSPTGAGTWIPFSQELDFSSGATRPTLTAHAAVPYNGEMYIFGGNNGSPSDSTTVFSYAPATDSWTTSPIGDWSAARSYAAVVQDGAVVYFVGGRDTATGTAEATVDKVDLSTGNYTTLASLPAARFGGFAQMIYDSSGNKYIAFFGGLTAFWSPVNTLYVYDVTGNTWGTYTIANVSGGTVPSIGCGGISTPTKWARNEMRIMGGYNSADSDISVKIYEVGIYGSAGAWFGYIKEEPRVLPVNLSNFAVADVDDDPAEFYIIGGYTGAVASPTRHNKAYKIGRWSTSTDDYEAIDLAYGVQDTAACAVNGTLIYNGGTLDGGVTNYTAKSSSTTKTITAASTAIVRKSYRVAGLDAGQYDVRVLRVTDDNTATNISNDTYWTALRSVNAKDSIVLSGVKTICMRIKASEQLNGIVDNLSCLVQTRLPRWSAVAGAYVKVISRNPADAYVQILTGNSTKNPLAVSRIDTTAIEAWAANCATASRWLDIVIDQPMNMLEALNTVAAVGRASYGRKDGLYSVVEDTEQTTIIQYFGPRNILKNSFSGTRIYKAVPHALRCRFLNADKDYQEDTRIVYADGYDSSTATFFEDLNLVGITNSDQVYRTARYNLAVGILRPEIYEFKVDPEHLVCIRGSLVRVQHPSMLVGSGSGRVRSVTESGGYVTSVTFDSSFALATATNYTFVCRQPDGDFLTDTATVATTDYHSTVNLTGSGIAAGAITAGDLAFLGTGQDCIVQQIEYDSDLNAVITAVPYDADIYTADSEEIPAFTSKITVTPQITKGFPDAPVIESIQSDEKYLIRDGDGSLTPRIAVFLKPYNSLSNPPKWVTGQVRRSDDTDGPWTQSAPQLADTKQILLTGVDTLIDYDIRIRYETASGLASEWTTQDDYTVIGKSSPPPDVTGFGYDVTSNGLRLFWDKVVVPDLWRYEVREGADWDNGTVLTGGVLDVLSLTLGFLATGDYDFWIKAQDTSENYSDTEATQAVSVTGPATPIVNGNAVNGNVNLAWQDCQTTYSIKEYRVYKGSTFAASSLITRTAANYVNIREDLGGTYTYWVQAIDLAGNLSTASSCTLAVADPTDIKVLDSQTVGFEDYDSITDIVFETDAAGDEVFGVPMLKTDSLEDIFSAKSWSTLQDAIDDGYAYYGQPVDVGTADYSKVFDLGGVISLGKISLAISQAQIDGDLDIVPTISISADGITYTDYLNAWSVNAINFQYVKISFDFTTDDDKDLSVLYNYTVTVSAQRQFEFGSISLVSSDVGGTVLTFSTGFVDVESVTVTPVSTSAYNCSVDSITATNCLVLAFDTSGNRVSTTASYFAIGV